MTSGDSRARFFQRTTTFDDNDSTRISLNVNEDISMKARPRVCDTTFPIFGKRSSCQSVVRWTAPISIPTYSADSRSDIRPV